jgi:hypothetical protein
MDGHVVVGWSSTSRLQFSVGAGERGVPDFISRRFIVFVPYTLSSGLLDVGHTKRQSPSRSTHSTDYVSIHNFVCTTGMLCYQSGVVAWHLNKIRTTYFQEYRYIDRMMVADARRCWIWGRGRQEGNRQNSEIST